jgi:HAD superfamily hydrolase (TIGR01549 family)
MPVMTDLLRHANLQLIKEEIEMYKHIIWDFDGTLFDTYPVMASVFKEMLEEVGIEEPLDDILTYMKISMTYAIQHYENKYHINSTFIEKYIIRRREKELSLCKPFAEIEDICRSIHSSGKKNYLYTHRGASAITLLKDYNLYEYFTDFITSQHGFERKPSPDAINYLVNKYSMSNQEAIMIGDRDLDILSAKNAGIHACFFNEDGEISDVADFSINNLGQLSSIL